MASLLKYILLLIQLSGWALALPRNDEPPALTTTSVSTQTSLELPYETFAVREEKNSTDSSFIHSCWDIDLDVPDGDLKKNDRPDGRGYKNSPRLAARCRELNGTKDRCTSISLGNCIANQEGFLKWLRNGNFHNSCQDCTFNKEGTSMLCQCHKDGTTLWSTIRLAEFIRNEDGRLACEGYRSDDDHCPPSR